MSRSSFFHFALAASAVALLTIPVTAADLAGSKDHPTVKRITGAQIFYFRQSNFDELTIAQERVVFDYEGQRMKSTKRSRFEGPHTTIYYALPGDASTLEAVRQYEAELKERGFEPIWSGSNEDLDDGYNRFVESILSDATKSDGLRNLHNFNKDEQRYTALRGKNAAGGEVIVSVYAFRIDDDSGTGFDELRKRGNLRKGQTVVRLDVIETKSMDARMTTVKAEEMQDAISKTGRIALYGIFFDTDKAEVKAESQPALAQIARLVKGAPGKKFLIVGHTDNQGAVDYNQSLSQRRAKSVVEALTRGQGVDAATLLPVGVGMAAPTATNEDEAGRAKNRRVEIVAM